MRHSLRPRRLFHRPQLVHLENRDVPAAAFALGNNSLLAFDTTNPTATTSTAITNVTGGETLVGIDFRPQNGLLYGLGVNAATDTGTVYAISTRTGFAAVVGTAGSVGFTTDGATKVGLPDPGTVGYGFDFNPAADRIRVVTASGLNFRINPNNGLPVDGDGVIAGTNPDGGISVGTTSVDGAAYTNNQPNGTVTTLYTLDAASNSLFLQNPPNGGIQTVGLPVTLGGNPLDFTAINGFDIPAGVKAAANNVPVLAGSAFAVLAVGGATGLYNINLVTATATLVGTVGTGTDVVSGVAVQSTLGGLPAIALSADAKSLVRFNTTTPGTATTVTLGATKLGETLVGIDFRPQTGQLFGLGVDDTTDTATLYLIDPQSGAVVAVGTPSQITFDDAVGVDVPLPPASAGYGFDFNPTVDRIRVTTSTGLNFRVNPNTGAPVDGDLGGAAGSVAGINTDGNINGGPTGASGTAYTNAFGQTLVVGVTTLYTLDAATDQLSIQNPPNAGTQTGSVTVTLGGATLDFTDVSGFDIPAGVRVGASSNVATGSGFAILTVGGASKLYTIDLTNGVAKLVGAAAANLSGLTLGDGSAGTVAFASATVSQSEAGPAAILQLVRTGGVTGAVSVTVNLTTGTAGAADFTTTSVVATFADGASTTSVNIPLTNDTIFEGDETFTATLSAPTNGAVLGAPASTTVTILDDDAQPTVTVGPASVTEGNAGTTPMTFTIALSNATTKDVTVLVNTANGTATAGSDYTALVNQLVTIPAGSTSKTVVVNVIGDTTPEPNETITLTISAPTNATLGAPTTNTGTITNDDNVPPTLVGSKQFSAGMDVGGNVAILYNPDGTVRFSITPFPGQPGGVRTAVGDFNGDGIGDLVVGTGPGGASHVKVFNGVTQAELFSVDPFEPTFKGGVYVAAGDINGDGLAELAITPDEGGGPRVRVFNGVGFIQIADFFGIDDPGFRGGARAAIGDLNADGKGDLIVAAGFGGGPRVAAFNGALLTPIGGPKLFGDFFAFEPTLRNGIFVASGDVNGDGFADVVAGGGPSGGPRVYILDGKSLVLNGSDTLVPLGNFFSGDSSTRGGIRVAVKNLDNDAKADVVTGSGRNIGSRVTAYLGANITPLGGTPTATLSFDAFPGFTGGVFVG